jgi:hypothetical protein
LVQSAAPASEYVPASQLEQVATEVAPTAVENLPASHSWHTFVLAPTTCEYFPALQSSQAADPDVSLNLPAMQNEQSPSGPVKPALHWHDDWPVSELCELTGHATQAAVPVVILNVPIEHLVQPPSVPVQPGAHTDVQLSAMALPAADVLPWGQSAQVEATMAPTAAENLPASQLVQTVDAAAAEYLPGTQLSHAVATVLAKPATLHVPVKPLPVTESSDVKVTLRKPVVDV